MAEALGGVYSAVATPFTAEQEVDEAGLRSLVDRTVDAGIDQAAVAQALAR